MFNSKLIADVVFSTEYHKESNSFTQLSLYMAALPIAFFGLALCWGWALQSFFTPVVSPAADILDSGIMSVIRLFGMVVTCLAFYLARTVVSLRWLYRTALFSTLALAIAQCLILVEVPGFSFGVAVVYAFVGGGALSVYLLLWMQAIGKFWRYRFCYGIIVSFLVGIFVFLLTVNLSPVYAEVLRFLLPAVSLVCWRYISFITKGIHAPNSKSDSHSTTLQSRISPISMGLGVALGFLITTGYSYINAENLPCILLGATLGFVSYALVVHRSASYMQTSRAYKISAFLLVIVSLGVLLLPELFVILLAVVFGIFAWTFTALFVSLTAAIVRNPRKQIYYTSCRGLLWLPLGLLLGVFAEFVLDASGVPASAIPMIVTIYTVLFEMLISILVLPANVAPDYEEVVDAGKFSQRCALVASKYALSSREEEVMRLFARGKTAKRVAEELTISPATVHTHLSHIYRKIGINSKEELMDIIENSK